MQTVTLGKTGITTTAAGLGCGGHSRIGLTKYGQEHAVGIVRAAYDAGVRFFDTATVYQTEPQLGEGLAGKPRDSYTVSTKFPYNGSEDWRKTGAEALARTLEQSLEALGTDHVDIYFLHGVFPEDYPDVLEVFLPVLQKARAQGKVRFLGITEQFASDPTHKTLRQALADDLFDAVMVGYNMLNPSAAKTVLPVASAKGVAVLNMFAVRSALSNPAQLKATLEQIIASGQGGDGLAASENALDFLLGEDCATIMEAAYRFCRHTPGVGVVLTGTGSREHLQNNLKSINNLPLSPTVLERLANLFGNVDCVSGQ